MRIDDISPIEHDMAVKVSSKNLLDFGLTEDTSQTKNGITITFKNDNTFVLNGKATEGIDYRIYLPEPIPLVKGESYAISFDIDDDVDETVLSSFYMLLSMSEDVYKYVDKDTKTFIATFDEITRISVIAFAKDITLDNVVIRPQLEESPTATPYTPFVDVSKVKVSTYGLNLLDIDKGLNECLTKNDDGSYTMRRTANNRFSADIPLVAPTEKDDINENSTRVCFMYCEIIDTNIEGADGVSVIFYNEDKTKHFTGEMANPTESYTTSVFEITNTAIVYLSQEVPVGSYITFKNPQIATGYYKETYPRENYEPYKEPVVYTPNADGTIEGVKSISPTTTFVSDTNGVVIDVGYNRDINKAFEEVVNAILSMGGNV